MATKVRHSLVRALRAVPEFERLDDRALVEIVGCSSNLVWHEGSEIFRPGEPAEALYIVLSGRVAILDEAGDEVAVVGPDESFGELSLLLHTNHSKRAVAREEAEVMVVPQRSLQELLLSEPELAEQLRRKVEDRLPQSPAGGA